MALVAVAAVYEFMSGAPEDIPTGPIAFHDAAAAHHDAAASATEDLNKLPATAAGAQSSSQLPHQAAPAPVAAVPRESLGGTTAKGRVRDVYVRVGEGVLLELSRVMPHQRDGWHYADIEFPEPLANGAAAARALVPERTLSVAVGDVVEMRFAHKGNTELFPVRERDQVTALVAKAGTQVAQDYERRIVARARVDFPPGLSSAFPRPGGAPATISEVLNVDSAAAKPAQ